MLIRAARLTTGLLLALVAVLVAPAVAGAHNDQANLSVESQSQTGPLTMDLRISARYTNDDELVEAIDLSVTGTGPDGATLATTPLTAVPDTVGLYGAELTFPSGGAWNLAITSTDPEAALNASVQVTEEETTTSAPDDADEATSTTATPPTDEDGDVEDGTALGPIVGGVAVVLVLAVVGTVLFLRRRGADLGDTDLEGG